jgi:glycosyltransferase involved in cell wall biosynthesis
MKYKVQVSVLIPAYNAAHTLRQALWSAVNQDVEGMEIIVYLDGCSDESMDIANAFVDHGVQVIVGTENKGIVNARNTLISKAKGQYIAWLDADDLWLPGKLQKQLVFMHAHPEVQVLGTWCEVRNSKYIRAVAWPTQPSLLQAWLLFRNPLVQSSLLIRRTTVIHYEADFEYLEDYRFVTGISGNRSVAILPEFLCSYLEPTKNGKVDKYLKYDFIRKAELILASQLEKLGLKYGKNDLSLFREFLSQNHKIKLTEADTLLRIMEECKKANITIGVVPQSALKTVLMLQHMRLFRLCSGVRLRLIGMFILHPYSALRAWTTRPRYIKRKSR